MTKDEVWKMLKSDKDKVYGQGMLDMFLRMTKELDRPHFDELSGEQKKLVNPNLRLRLAFSSKDKRPWLSEARAAVNDGAKDFNSALFAAVHNGRKKACVWLSKKGAKDFGEAMYFAGTGGRIKMCDWLMTKGAGRDRMFIDNALLGAASEGHLRVCKWAYKKGARDFENALINAAMGGHLEVCNWLAEKGANYFEKALAWGTIKGHIDICKWAVGKGANYIPLHVLGQSKSPEVTKYLQDSERDGKIVIGETK